MLEGIQNNALPRMTNASWFMKHERGNKQNQGRNDQKQQAGNKKARIP